jgi:4a-hydroxytetrahydrobiopterin dehydratase
MDKLSPEDIRRELGRLEGWEISGGAIKKDFKFKDFTAAIGFMNRLAIEAERLNHHPDWSNSYNKVSISLTTHSAGGLTEKDFALARSADKAAKH